MSQEKTLRLIEWLETSQTDRKYSLDDMKELLSIAMIEIGDNNIRMYDGLPGSTVDAIIEEMKASGEYYLLDRKVESFKSRFM